MPTEHCVSGLACAKVCSALKMAEGKQEKGWLFTDYMVEKLIYFLQLKNVHDGLARSEMASGQCATC